MNPRFHVKSLRGRFIEPQNLRTPLQRAQFNGLKRIGSLTRTVASRSMRKGRRATPSEYPRDLRDLMGGGRDAKGRFTPGVTDISPIPMKHSKPFKEPPLYYTKLIRRHIYFDPDFFTMSVITGVAALPGIRQKGTPELLEHGGQRTEDVGQWVKFWSNGKPMIRLAKYRTRSVTYRERPFMEPAQDKAVGQLVPRVWEDSLK